MDKDREQVNTNTVWQWRISLAKKYSTHPEPFFYSNRIGLEFNVGSSSHKKLNPPFVPNGVILEVCEFARTINKSGIHFIPKILENNFDLGFESDQQRIDFTAQLQHKLEELIQNPPTDAHGVLAPFDIWNTECTSNKLYMVPMVQKPQRSLVEDIGELEHLFKCSSEKVTEEISGSHTDGDDQKHDTGCLGIEREEQLNENNPLLFPFCESISLNLGSGTKQKLDPGLLSKGVMLELVAFARVLTASFTSIVASVLEHNFELGLQKQQRRNEVWLLISQMLEKLKQMAATNMNISPEFKNEPFFFDRDPLKRSYVKALSTMETLLSVVTKRQKLDFNTPQETVPLSVTKCIINKDQGHQDLSHNTDLCPSEVGEDEQYYLCPVEDDTDSENENDIQNSTGCDISTESLSNPLGTQNPATNYDSFNSSTMNKDIMRPFVPHSHETVVQTCEETQISRNALNDCGMKQDLAIDYNMWKMRARRAKNISLALDKEPANLQFLRYLFVEFDVGFGPKQNFSIDRLTTTPFLVKLARFALAINSSQQEFILEILENNFDLGLQSECDKKAFMCEVMNKVKDLQRCEDVVKFSKEFFELPVSVSPVDIVCLSNNSVVTEPSTISSTGYCKDIATCAPSSHPETGLDSPSEPESASEDTMDLYPFCKEIGLKLQVNYRQSIGKLDVNKLTKGAMTEIVNFAEKLCGTFEQICMDVLRHNFDLQGMDSTLAATIFCQIAAVNENKNLCANLSQKMVKHDLTDPSILMYRRKPSDIPAQNDPNMLLWMLRANHVQHILSVPHGEQCPLYSYPRCKKLGLDFDVASGAKRNLDPKCLTNGIMVELLTFAKTLQSSEKDFMTEILEHNFDLKFKSELHRSAFARQLKAKVARFNFRKRKYPLKKRPFELPDLSCLEECPPYCPKCHQDRNENLPREESVSQRMPHVHPHGIKEKSHAPHCTKPVHEKTPIANFSSTEILTKYYHQGKEAGLSLCVDRDHPREKLDLQSLTEEVMFDVYRFAQKLCGTKYRIIHEVLMHNFNFSQDHVEDITYFCYKCKTTGADLSWFNETVDLEKVPSQNQNGLSDCFQKASSFGITKESSCEVASHSSTTDDLPSLPVNTDLSPPLSKLSDEIRQQEGEAEAGILKNITNEFDINVRNFHSNLLKDQSRLSRLRKIDIDVGFGPPRNLSTDLLTASVLYEVACFALELSSSQQKVIVDILQYNFILGLQSEYHKEKFAREVMKRVQVLLALEDKDKFSKEVFALPCSLSFTNEEFWSDRRDDSGPETSQTPDVYPFCKEIGLRLDVSCCHRDKKLDINRLTNGAMIEVVHFAEKLCGSYEQVCVDILRHNFDLDLQSADSNLAKNILAQIPFAIEESKLAHNFNLPIRRNLVVMDSQLDACSQMHTASPVEAKISQSATIDCEVDARNNLEMLLWKLRANRVQQIISETHKEQCPLYSYTRCKKLGIDFDVASGRKRNLDPKLLTNGIMSELFTFAAEFQSSAKHFVMEILEYNFDLRLKDKLHRSAFGDALWKRIKMMYKKKRFATTIRKTQFELPEERSFREVAPFCTKCSHDDLCHIESKPDDVLNDSQHIMANVASAGTDCKEKKPTNAPMSTFPATEMLMKHYPYANKAGVSLCVDKAHPKVKLDKCNLTYEVMRDICRFSSRLVATYGGRLPTINDILEHNFSLDKERLLDYPVVGQVKFYDGEPSWFDEVFDLNHIPKDKVKSKEPPSVLSSERKELFQRRKLEMQKNVELITQRQESKLMEKTRSSHHSDLSTSEAGEDYMCPVEEDTDSENDVHEDHCENPAWWDKSSESQMNNVGKHHLAITDAASMLNVNTPMNSPSDEEQAHVLKNVPNICDLHQEDMDPELKMWKLRANRVREIVSTLNTMPCQIFKSRVPHLNVEFDVGFQPKRNLNADHLTNYDLFNVALFALEMTASQEEFMMEILKYNFDLGRQSQYNEKSLVCEVLNQVKELINCEEAVTRAKEVFEFPGLLSFSDLEYQNSRIKSEPQPTLITKECAVSPPAAPHLPVENKHSTATESSRKSVDLHPFCNDIGLNLNVCGCQTKKKLDINKLTKGAMIEVVTFAEKLCGSYEQICVDVLRHNFDLGLQSADSDLARKILGQVPVVIEQRNYDQNSKRAKFQRKFDPIDINWQNSTSSEPSTGPVKANIDRSVCTQSDIRVQHYPDLLLWRLRANRIQQILSEPHGEKCPLYPYSRCKKTGIDFNVASRLKQSLDPWLLTNGIMNELWTFAEALLSSAKHFTAEIWEYNFDLNLKSEHHRNAFIEKANNSVRNLRMQKLYTQTTVFKMPDPEGIEEKAPDCRKCYQDRATAGGKCSELKPDEAPIATFPSAEILTKTYYRCKDVGLSLCVDRNYPRDKLDMDVLTLAVQKEIYLFVNRLCGAKAKVKTIADILEHNFKFGMRDEAFRMAFRFCSKRPDAGEPAWFNEVFQLKVIPPKQTYTKNKEPSIERKEMLKRRRLEMQANKERMKVPALERPNRRLKSHHGNENISRTHSKKGLTLDRPSESVSKSNRTRVKSLSMRDEKRFQMMQDNSSSDDEWLPPEYRLLNASSNPYSHIHIKEEMDDPLNWSAEIDWEELYPCGDDVSRYLDNQGDLFTVNPQEFTENMYLRKLPSGEVVVADSEMNRIQYNALPAPQVSGHPNVFYPPGQYMMETVSNTDIVMCDPLRYSMVTLQPPLNEEETQEQAPDETPF